MTDKAIEHLQQELKEKDKTIFCIIESLQAKTKECDELISGKDFYLLKIETLEDKCEELKAQLEIYSKMLNNPEFKAALTDIRTGERDIWKCKAERYEQALDEIEENIRHCIKQDICTLCAYADKCRNEFDYNAYDNNIFILDIISKAKDGNND